MSDYISREAALEALCADCCTKECNKELCQDRHNLSVVPAADVRPVVRGRWDDKPVAFFLKCSKCGCCVGHRYDVFLDRGELNFCPNCGADMRGENDV